MGTNPLYGPSRALMEALGYRKKGPANVYMKELTPGIFAWVGLNAGSEPGRLSLTPTIAVRHQEVRRWLAVLLDWETSPWMGTTVQTGLGNLITARRPGGDWVLLAGEDEHNTETWATFERELEEFGMPWMVARSKPEHLVEALRRGEGMDTSRLSLPILLWLMGDAPGARAALDHGRTIPPLGGIVVDYEDFAARLLAEVDAHPDGPG